MTQTTVMPSFRNFSGWRKAATVIAAVGAIGLAGCGSGASPSPVRAGDTTAGPGTTEGVAAPITLSEPQNGTTVPVALGTEVVLVLHNTYWTVDGSSAPAVLAADGGSTKAPAPNGGGCVPGQGCGTVTARYKPATAGTATITAHRQSCGEAMACPPDQASYTVTIRVA